MDEWRRSGQIPAFGNWDFANELPITQYFECARQAGLVRHSSCSGESDRDLYALDFQNHVRPLPPSIKKGRRNRWENNSNMNRRKQGKVWDVRETEAGGSGKANRKINKVGGHPVCPPPPAAGLAPPRRPKPVDQDLYKIPPELLRTPKRSKMLGFICRCVVPRSCVG